MINLESRDFSFKQINMLFRRREPRKLGPESAGGASSGRAAVITNTAPDPPARDGKISVSTIGKRQNRYAINSSNSAAVSEIDGLNKLYSRSETEVSVRLAAHLLRLEAEELGVETTLNKEVLHQGIASGDYKVAIANAGVCCMRGVALAERTETGYDLTHWYVVDRLRGKGIGTALLNELGVPKPQKAEPTQLEPAPVPYENPAANAEAVA